MKRIYSLMLTLIVCTSSLFSQLTVGADIKSRYVWRGIDFGNSPSFQPALTYKAGIFSVGIWGAYSFPGATVYAENDYWASVDIPTSSGTFSAIITDYTFPSSGIRLGNFDDNGAGAHTIEVGLQYAGPETLPIILRGYMNVHNDVDNSLYVETSYPFALDDITLAATLGASAYKSLAYGTNGFTLINISLTAIKTVAVTEKFSLPISTSFVLNPQLEQATIIFGLTL